MADKKMISEILEEAGPGTKCWNDTFGELTFVSVNPRIIDEYPIITVKDMHGSEIDFLGDGRFNSNGIPCLWPSRNKRTWENFGKWDIYDACDGDILVREKNPDSNVTYIFIFKKLTDNDHYASFYVKYCLETDVVVVDDGNGIEIDTCDKFTRLATEGEKKLLKKMMEENNINI